MAHSIGSSTKDQGPRTKDSTPPEGALAQRLGRRAAALLFVLALAVRMVAIGYFGFSTIRFGDARAYLSAARTLVETRHYPRATEPYYFRAPGYPFFLVAATLGHPERIVIAKIANAILGGAGVLLIALLSSRLFRRRGLALATGAAAALHPGLISVSTDVQSEPLFLVLLLGAGFFLLAAADRPSSNLAVAAGLALALAALTRPDALALLPLAAAPLFDRRYPMRARGHLAASALLGFVLGLAPWTARNALVYRELLPINDAGGSNFYQGNSDRMVRFYELKSFSEYQEWSRAMFADLERQTRAIDASSGGSPAAKSRYFIRKTLEERRGDLAGWARLLLRKSWDWVRPYPNPLFWPSSVVWTTGALDAVLTLFAAVGLVVSGGPCGPPNPPAVAPRPGVRLFVLVYLALTMASHVALIVVWRYRISYWDPVLILYGVFGVAGIFRKRPVRGLG